MQIQNIFDIQALTKIARTIAGSAFQVAFSISYKWTHDDATNNQYFWALLNTRNTHSAWLALCKGNPQFELSVEVPRFFEAGAEKTNNWHQTTVIQRCTCYSFLLILGLE